jgi:transcriptional regulator NrdR family protein
VVDVVQVKKRDGGIQDFVQSKLEASVKKAGATAEQATQVAKLVAKKVANKIEVTSAKLSDYVVAALRKINKKAADAYAAYRDRKLKQKEQKK